MIYQKAERLIGHDIVPDSEATWPLPNATLLASCCDQEDVDERVSILLRLPFATRGLSLEPLIGPVRLEQEWLYPSCDDELNCLRWVIIGGESGPKARPCDLAWVCSIVEQCRVARIPCFVKQLRIDGKLLHCHLDFPPDLRVRQIPGGVP